MRLFIIMFFLFIIAFELKEIKEEFKKLVTIMEDF